MDTSGEGEEATGGARRGELSSSGQEQWAGRVEGARDRRA